MTASQPDQLLAVLGVGVVDAAAPLVVADDLGLTRGDGCFDAARVVVDGDGKRVDHLDAHLARFACSCAALELARPDLDAWKALIAEALAAWDRPGEATLKLVVTRGPEHLPSTETAYLTITPSAAALGPLTVATLSRGHASDAFRDAPWLLGGVKTLAYAVNVAARREAARRGVDDVLFVSTDGYCLEGPTSSLVVAFGDGYATTPTGATGVLASVTTQVVVDALRADGVEFVERLIGLDELAHADGAWLMSAVRGVCPIVTLDGRPMPSDAVRTGLLQRLAGFDA